MGRSVRSVEKPMSVEELREGLRLSNVVDREVHIQECDVLDGRAMNQLKHGLEWIAERMVLYARIRTVPRKEKINVRWSRLNGDVVEEIVIDSLTSVAVLKELIAHATGIPPRRQHLMVDTVMLNDGDLVSRHCQQGTRTASVLLIEIADEKTDAARMDEHPMRSSHKTSALVGEGSDDYRTAASALVSEGSDDYTAVFS